MKAKIALLRPIGVLMALLVFVALPNSLLAICSTCHTPTFEIAGGGGLLYVTVTTDCPSDATIYYTINGGTPTHSSAYGANGLVISVPYGYTYCIRAIAAKTGHADSAVAYLCQHNPEP
jgi:hypothetical protein